MSGRGGMSGRSGMSDMSGRSGRGDMREAEDVLVSSGSFRMRADVLREMKTYAEAAFIPVIKPDTWAFLNLIGNIAKPRRVLEIGTAMGYSAILMSTFICGEGTVDTVERDFSMVALARSYIKKAGLDSTIRVIAGEAADILPNVGGSYDLIFLDAAKGQYPELLPGILRILCKGGILIADNVLYKGLVEEAKGMVTLRGQQGAAGGGSDYMDTMPAWADQGAGTWIDAGVVTGDDQGTATGADTGTSLGADLQADPRKHRTISSRLRQFIYDIENNKSLISCVIPVGDGLAVCIKK